MASRHTLVIGLLLLLAVSAALADPAEQETKAWGTLLDLEIIDEVLGVYMQENESLELPSDWTPLRSFAKTLPGAYRDRLPQRDTWGNDFLVGALEDHLVVISSGPDKVSDVMIGLAQSESSQITHDWLGDDIVLVVGSGIENGPVTTRQKLKVCMADLRSVGTAIESFSIDNNRYPLQEPGLLDLTGIESELEPIYIRVAPLRDPWGNPFLYWSDGTSYVLISVGADGIPDRSYIGRSGPAVDIQLEGGFSDPNTDIVFADGQFVQWPEVVRR